MAHVFISHSSKDKQIADALCNKLESSGISCWMVPRDIPPGIAWGQAIVQAIRNCQLMILVFSENANHSDHVQRELELAAGRHLSILPFAIEDVQLSDSFAFYLGIQHSLKALTPPVEQHLPRYVDSVKLFLSNLPKKNVVTDDERIVREKEEARRRVEEEAHRREEELEQKRQEAEKLKRKQQEAEAEAARKAQKTSTRTAHDVFISHSSKDKQIANAMCHKLESSGIRCWITPETFSPVWTGVMRSRTR